jgi:lipopolysaccharide biosynthesis glycosyltransferase
MEADAPATRLVILATDENYAAPCGVTMESLLQNTSAPSAVHFAIFGRDLRENTEAKLRKISQRHSATIEVRSTEAERFEGLPIIEVGSLDTFTRLYAPAELTSYDQALYIDCDVLVERDIGELFSMELTNAVAAAVPHGPTPFVSAFREQHGFSVDQPVFNAGVMMIDPQRWTEQKIASRAVKWIDAHDRDDLYFPDQDAINVLLTDEMKPLGPQWNMEARYHREEWMGISDWWSQNDTENVVIHYTGPRKPWKRWVYVPRQWAYRAYLEDTPFAKSGLMTRSDAAFTLERAAAWLHMMMHVTRVRLGGLSDASSF